MNAEQRMQMVFGRLIMQVVSLEAALEEAQQTNTKLNAELDKLKSPATPTV